MLQSVTAWSYRFLCGLIILSARGPQIRFGVTEARNIGKYIIGGNEAGENAWPWQVIIYRIYPTYDEVVCGGSIISKIWIATAAHCFYHGESNNRVKDSEYLFVFGTHNITDAKHQSGVQKISPIKIYVHENYDNVKAENGHDVALVKLSKGIIYGKHVKPIELANSEVGAGTMCVVTGFGQNSTNGKIFPTKLLEVYLPIVERDKCAEQHEHVIYPNQICAGVPLGEKTSCHGDSGGPLACNATGKWKLEGIVSFGVEGCVSATHVFPSVYSSIPYHLSFIQRITGENEDAPAVHPRPNVSKVSRANSRSPISLFNADTSGKNVQISNDSTVHSGLTIEGLHIGRLSIARLTITDK